MKKASYMREILSRRPRLNIKRQHVSQRKNGILAVWKKDAQGSVILLRFLDKAA